MKRLVSFILALFCLMTVLPAAAQDVAPGDTVLVVDNIASLHTQPFDSSPIVQELAPGSKTHILAVRQDSDQQTWFYLDRNGFGWLKVETAGNPTIERFSAERLEQMKQEATATLNANPNDINAYITRGTIYLTQQNYDQSVIDYSSAIALAGKDGSLFEYRGKALLDADKNDQARNDFRKAIELGRKLPSTFNRLAFTYLNNGDLESAIQNYENAIQIEPGWGLLYSNLGNVYKNEADYDTALDYYGQSLDHDPLYVTAYYNRGLTYRDLKDDDAALADFSKAIEIDPYFSDAYVKRGIIYDDTYGDRDAALADFNKGVETDPENDRAYAERGVHYVFTGDSDLAVADLKHALQLNPHNDDARYNLASFYGYLGRYNEALNSYTEAINIADTHYDVAALLYRPQIYVALGDYQSALNDIDDFIDNRGGDGDYFATTAFLVRAYIHADRGEYLDAAQDYNFAFDIQTDFARNYAIWGAGYRVTPLREALINDVQQKIATKPKQADLYLQLANLYIEFGRWQEAIDTYTSYLNLSPNPDVKRLVDMLQQVT